MAGIEILASEQVVTGYTFGWVPCLVAFFFVTVIFIVITLPIGRSIIETFCVSAFCGLLVGVLTGATFVTPTYVTEYKMTISEEVSMIDFYERYEVMKQEDKIFTVREKEQS